MVLPESPQDVFWNGRRDTPGYSIKADRHGSVTIGASGIVEAGLAAVAEDPASLRFVWEAVSALASAIAPNAPKHVTILLSDPGHGGKQISRWWGMDGPSPLDLLSIQREARRTQGVAAFEDDPA